MTSAEQISTLNSANVDKMQAQALLAFRICLVPLFYFSGYGKFMNFEATAARLPGAGNSFSLFLAGSAILVELGFATLFLLGIRTRLSASILIGFIIAATVMFHPFWAVPEAQVAGHTIHFLKNLGLVGALLVAAAFGPGPYAIRIGKQG